MMPSLETLDIRWIVDALKIILLEGSVVCFLMIISKKFQKLTTPVHPY